MELRDFNHLIALVVAHSLFRAFIQSRERVCGLTSDVQLEMRLFRRQGRRIQALRPQPARQLVGSLLGAQLPFCATALMAPLPCAEAISLRLKPPNIGQRVAENRATYIFTGPSIPQLRLFFGIGIFIKVTALQKSLFRRAADIYHVQVRCRRSFLLLSSFHLWTDVREGMIKPTTTLSTY